MATQRAISQPTKPAARLTLVPTTAVAPSLVPSGIRLLKLSLASPELLKPP